MEAIDFVRESKQKIVEIKMNDIVKKENNNIVTMTPDTMISLAIQNGNFDQLEKLFAMKERYDAAEAKKAFVQAMSKFRSKCIRIAKTRKGYNYKYAGLAETIEQISPHLVECNLSHRWETKQENGQITVTCHLTHNLGHSEMAEMSGPPDPSGGKNSIQAVGSAVSYLQRYTLFSVCGLASREMDDDGNTYGLNIIDDNQLANITALIDEVRDNMDYDRFLKAYGIKEPGQLTKDQYDKAVKALESKRR